MSPLPPRGTNRAPRAIIQVVVIGGVHGNERTGVHAVQYISTHPDEFTSGSITKVRPLFGNPRAILKNVRYTDLDLNRCFKYDYANPMSEAEVLGVLNSECSYEVRRSLEIRREIGALERPVDFLIDLHTTTSAMGSCIIVSDNDPWTENLCACLSGSLSDCRIMYDPVSREDDLTSSSLGLNQITIEMGPIQQGVGIYQHVKTALDIVKEIVLTVDRLNGKAPGDMPAAKPPEKFQRLFYKVDYPRDASGMPAAVIHPDFLGADYRLIRADSPLFTRFDGSVLCAGDEGCLPPELKQRIESGEEVSAVFIGESAYVEKGMAFVPVIKIPGGGPA